MAPRAKRKAKKAAPKKAARRKARKKMARASARKAPAKKAVAKRQWPEKLRVRQVSPGLTVGDLQKSIGFYRDVMGFHLEETWKNDAGVVRGASMVAGAARFYIGQDDWAKGRDRKKGEGFRLNLTTAQSVDDIAAGIKKRGGRLDSEPMTMPWGSRQFSLTDPDGFKISITQQA